MKIFIVHFSHFLLSSGSGVTEKTLAVAQALRRREGDVQVVNFSSKIAHDGHDQVTFVHYHMHNKWEVIAHWLETNVSNKDIVWIRYPFADKHFLQLTQRWGKQIVLEHNTIETQEVLLLQKKSFNRLPFQWRKSYFIYFFQTWILNNTNETRYGHQILKNVLGGICVTHEIAQFERYRYNAYVTMVLPNGVEKVLVNDGQDRRPLGDINVHQKWVMVIGSLADWHGLDRLEKSLEKATSLGHRSLNIDIIGLQGEPAEKYQGFKKNGVTIQCLGKLQPQELETKLWEYDLAIGSLALYKIGIKEACPLKVREYWKAGTPVLLAYRDTACMEHPLLGEFNYSIPNSGSLIKVKDVFDWVAERYGDRSNHGRLQQAAKAAIEYDSKAHELMIFLRKLKG